MTPVEVDDLYGRIAAKWPNVDREAWVTVLAPAEFDVAERTLTVLRQRLQRLPSTHEFTVEYAAQGPERNRMTPAEIAAGLERVAWLKTVYAESRLAASTRKDRNDV